MKYYSQLDKRYKNKKLGRSNLSIGDYGCTFTSICNLAQVDPLEVINSDYYYDLFTDSGLLYTDRLAAGLNMRAVKKRNGSLKHDKNDFKDPCLGVTMIGKLTHFYIILEDGRIVDPLDLDPKPKETTYRAYQYRHFEGYATETPPLKVEESQEIDEAIYDMQEALNQLKKLTKK